VKELQEGGDDDFDNDGIINDLDYDDDNDGIEDDEDEDDDNDGKYISIANVILLCLHRHY